MRADVQKMRIYRLGLLVCSVAFAHPAFSQSDIWSSSPVPDTIVATCLTTDSDGAIFVGTYGGIYRSTNGGLDWASIAATFPGFSGKCYAILRASDDAIWAADGLRLCKTTDKGNTWQVMQYTTSSDFYFGALVSGEHYGILLSLWFHWSNWSENIRSTDGGATWSKVPLDGFIPSTFVERGALILSSGYMGSGDRYVAGYHAVKLSTDGGVSWNGILGHFEQDFPGIEIDQYGAFYVSKTDWSAGKGGVFRSTTLGASWQLQDCGRGTATVRCFAVTPDSQVFAGSPTGVYRIPVASAPYAWTPADNGITDSNIVFLHMSVTGDLYALSASGHLFVIRPALMSRPPMGGCTPPSAPLPAAPRDGTHVLPGAPVTISWHPVAGATFYRVTIAFDGGSYQETTVDTTYTGTFGLNPGVSSSTVKWYVEAASAGGYGPTSDTWTFIIGGAPSTGPVLIGPVNGSYFVTPSSVRFIWHSVPDADSYNLITIEGTQGVPISVRLTDTTSLRSFATPADIAWSVQGANGGGVGASSEQRNFVVRNTYPPPRPVEPADSAYNSPTDVLFRWTRSSTPGGYRLEICTNSQFEGSNVRSFGAIADTAFLVKGLETGSRFYWRVAPDYALTDFSWSPVTSFTTSVNPGVKQISNAAPEVPFISQNFPNPFNGSTSFEFGIPGDGIVELRVYSLTGELVSTVINTNAPAGTFRLEWSPGSIASGVYLYQFRGGGLVLNGKLLYLK